MKYLFITLIFICLLSFSINAETVPFEEVYDDIYQNSGLDKVNDSLDDKTKEYLERLKISPDDINGYKNFDIKNIFSVLFENINEMFKTPFSIMYKTLAVIFLSVIIKNITDKKNNVYEYICTLAVAAVCLSPVINAIFRAGVVLQAGSVFIMAFIPVYAGILIANMRAGTAASVNGMLFAASQGVNFLSVNVIVPVLNMFLALSVASSVTSENTLSSIISTFKKTVIWVLGIFMVVFTGVLTIRSSVASAADSVGAKTAKFFISSFVPVVGGTVSEALGSIMGCMNILKATAGIYSILAIIFIFAPIIIELSLMRLILAICSGAAEAFECGNIKNMTDGIASAITLLITILVITALVFMVSLTVVVAL